MQVHDAAGPPNACKSRSTKADYVHILEDSKLFASMYGSKSKDRARRKVEVVKGMKRKRKKRDEHGSTISVEP